MSAKFFSSADISDVDAARRYLNSRADDAVAMYREMCASGETPSVIQLAVLLARYW